jgi:hypothetical protein
MSTNTIPPLTGSKLVVKFYFTNHKLVPANVRLVLRREDALETKHLQQGQQLGLQDGGYEAERRDRVDTGRHEQINEVDLFDFWETAKKNFQIVDVHIFWQSQQGTGMKKPVLTITFVPEGSGQQPDKKIPDLIEQIEKNFIRNVTWGIVHLWTNPNGTVTLNCLRRQPQTQRPQQQSQQPVLAAP